MATGPLSTLAVLVQDPDIKSRIDQVYILGGQLAAPDPETLGEANFAWDPKAVKIVMESGLDITLFPVELTGTQYIEEEELQNLSRQGTWPEFLDLIRANQAAHAKPGKRMRRCCRLFSRCSISWLRNSSPWRTGGSPWTRTDNSRKIPRGPWSMRCWE